MRYLICYDIADDRRRRKVVRLLEEFGVRLHESAFWAHLSPGQHNRLNRRVRPLLNEKLDKLTIYPVCERDGPDIRSTGAQSDHMQAPGFAIVV